jgi:hypothetical protein
MAPEDAGFTVPAALRGARFVPRQSAGQRRPAEVTPGAFRAAGLPVPEHAAQRNAYQLSRRQGVPWSTAIDRHIARRGGEVLGHGRLVQVDIDVPAAVDGSPMLDTLRWLCDRAAASGEMLDLGETLTVRTPGHPDTRHLPGWHLWYLADPGTPVRMGPMTRCTSVELRGRGTCPGSPGYRVHADPDRLATLPRWIADLAGPPPAPAVMRQGSSGANPETRLQGIISTLLAAGPGQRNHLLYWASGRVAELVAAGDLDRPAAEKLLHSAAAEIGLAAEDGYGAVASTIASGFRQAVPA